MRGTYRAAFESLADVQPAERPCDRCELAPAIPDDTLCAECRVEIDDVFADLPGAEAQ